VLRLGILDLAEAERAVTPVATKAKAKRPAARRGFASMAVWLRGSSVQDPQGVWASQVLQVSFPKVSRALSRIAVSLVAPRPKAIATKHHFQTGSQQGERTVSVLTVSADHEVVLDLFVGVSGYDKPISDSGFERIRARALDFGLHPADVAAVVEACRRNGV